MKSIFKRNSADHVKVGTWHTTLSYPAGDGLSAVMQLGQHIDLSTTHEGMTNLRYDPVNEMILVEWLENSEFEKVLLAEYGAEKVGDLMPILEGLVTFTMR